MAVTPKPSATIILLRDSDQGIETLIMKRNKKVNFLGGFWVFPGGVVESEDEVAESKHQTMVNAAVRETEEEAGLIIAHDSLYLMSRWITPLDVPKRFDTWFFVAQATDQEVQVDGSEMTESLWVKPAIAIEKHRAQEIDMLPPTLVSLMAINAFDNVKDVLLHYDGKEPLLYEPRVSFNDDQLAMLYAGDAGYTEADASNLSGQHRCLHTQEGWVYKNEIGVEL